jgi:hypothetical protein
MNHCPVCEGFSELLGFLGATPHMRCRNCGLTFSPKPSEVDTCLCTSEDCSDKLHHGPGDCHYPPAEGRFKCEECPA